MKKISVCMAVYNGEKYILEQIQSILNEINQEDELIIVDDNSKDKSLSIIEKIKDNRIKIYHNEINIGVNKTFEKAIKLASKEYIFLADQDDIWEENRVIKMKKKLEKNFLVAGNQNFINSSGNIIEYTNNFLKRKDSKRWMLNLIKIFLGKIDYVGCTMAFRKELKKIILPFPDYIESHDLWIIKAGILIKSIYHLEDIVLNRRIHGENTSIIRRKFSKKIKSRLIFTRSLLELKLRIKRKRWK